MAGGVAIAVAGRSCRAGLRQAPIGGEARADLARQQFRVGLRGRTDSLHGLIRNVHQNAPGTASRAAEINPPVEDSATAMVWRRSISLAAIFSAIATRSFIDSHSFGTVV